MKMKKACLFAAVIALILISACGMTEKEKINESISACPALSAYPIDKPYLPTGITVYNKGAETIRISREVRVERKDGSSWAEVSYSSGFGPLTDPWWDIAPHEAYPVSLFRWLGDPIEQEGLYRVTVFGENETPLARCEFRAIHNFNELPLAEKLALSPFSEDINTQSDVQITIDPTPVINPDTGALQFSYTMKNLSDRRLSTGESTCWPEIRLNGKWYSILTGPDDLMAVELPPHSETGPLFFSLRSKLALFPTDDPDDFVWPDGEYRLIKRVEDAESGTWARYFQTFELKR